MAQPDQMIGNLTAEMRRKVRLAEPINRPRLERALQARLSELRKRRAVLDLPADAETFAARWRAFQAAYAAALKATWGTVDA